MNDRSDEGSLELEVSNFGPIVEAKIDLRPLTVFIGPSNTGKSYLAILIYALHRFFGNGGLNRGRSQYQNSTIYSSADFAELSRTAFKDIFNGGGSEAIITEKGIVLSDSVAKLVHYMLCGRGKALQSEIGRCFSVGDLEALICRETGGEAKIAVRSRNGSGNAPIDQSLTVNPTQNKFEAAIPIDTRLQVPNDNVRATIRYHRLTASVVESMGRQKADLPDSNAAEALLPLMEYLIQQLLGQLYRSAYYLPADRTGVMNALNVVVRSLIDRAAMAGLRPEPQMQMLSGVLADFFEQLIELDAPQSRIRFGRGDLDNAGMMRGIGQRELGKQIEDAVLDGSVGLERSGAVGYPRFTYTPIGWKNSLSLMNASSMVSELAPVVLYLRYLVKKGNVLIVEEPESHLHPAKQVEFTRQLAALVQGGVRVIITTHSEWVLEELANIVRRSEVPASEREKLRNGEFTLEPQQVGCWLFQPKRRRKGTVVNEIRLDESGIFPSGFEEVATALHNDWADLASRTGETE